jgi:uncharacterized protein DUF3108
VRFRIINRQSFALRVVSALLLIATSYCLAAGQQETATALPFARGEQLVYQAELNRGLLRGFDVGEIRFSAGAATDGKGQVLTLVGDAISKGVLIRLSGNRFHIHIESRAEAQPFTVLQTKGLYEDKRTTINSEAIFDHTAQKVLWTQTEKDKKSEPKTLPFSDPAHDVLTLIYFVRTQTLKPGESFEVGMVDAGRTYRCVVNVVAGKKTNTAVGRVNTITVEPAIFDGERQVRPRGALTISMTDDARHLPVKAQVKSNIGTIDITLKRVSYHDVSVAQK